MIITRYLMHHIFKTSAFVALVLTMVIWLTQSLHFLELIVSSNAPAGIFLQMIFLSLPKFLEIILPVALMSGILFTYNRMTTDNELIVMRACGVNQTTLAGPAIIIAMLVTAVLLLFSLWLSPVAHTSMQHTRQVIKAEYSSFLLREGVFNNVGKGLTVYLKNRLPNGELEGLLIHDARDTSQPPVTVTAKRGIMIMSDDTPSVIVYDGSRQQLDSKSNALSRLDFQQYKIEITGLKKEARKRWKKPNERTFSELLNPNMDNSVDAANKQKFIIEAHKRLTTPFYALSFTFIALSCLLVGSFNRRGQTRRILIAIILLVLLQSASLGVVNLARKYSFAIILMYILSIAPVLFGSFMLTQRGEKLRRRFYALISKPYKEASS